MTDALAPEPASPLGDTALLDAFRCEQIAHRQGYARRLRLIAVACLRWPVEEGFEFGKDHFGLDHSQVRLHTALQRHIVLTMAALAVCAVTAADARTRAPAPILPTSPDEQPPADPGLIALTVAEIKRLFILATRRLLPDTHHEHWTWWRRRHQARARWFHHRNRLRRSLQPAQT